MVRSKKKLKNLDGYFRRGDVKHGTIEKSFFVCDFKLRREVWGGKGREARKVNYCTIVVVTFVGFV